ncbi:MAG: chorismate-binding protein [Candidatus Sericytochromatia bacterium]
MQKALIAKEIKEKYYNYFNNIKNNIYELFLPNNGNIGTFSKKIPLESLNSISIFNHIKKLVEGKCFLFENNEKGKRAYSFLGINPREVLKIRDGIISLEKKGKLEYLEGDVNNVLSEYLTRYQAEKIDTLPPFVGGVIGYIGYDFNQHLEKIALPTNNSFQEYETCLMLFHDVIAIDHENNELYLISNFFIDGKVKEDLDNCIKKIELMNEELRKVKLLEKPDLNFTEKDFISPNMSFGKENFYKAVKKVKNYIKNGDIFQCVLAEKFSMEIKAENLLIYHILSLINPSPYLFFIETETETILGSSPEMLVKVADKKVHLCPIAGTRPRGKTEEEDKKYRTSLLRSVKEKAEHLMLVDLGRNDVGKVSKAGTVKVEKFMQVEKFSAVMHLVSLVEGEIKDEKTSFEAFKACFPAGTLSGAPKVRAMQIISELEPVRRGAYGGAIFCHGFSGYLDSCITIRSLYVIRDKNNYKTGYIQAGAGIVADSKAEAEYQEILNKSKAVLKAVSIAQKIAEKDPERKGVLLPYYKL